jgi:uncharacterized protein YecT (DUF1311 family)
MRRPALILTALCLCPVGAGADPTLECSGLGSQVEIGNCVGEAEARVNAALDIAYGAAMQAAVELDEITGRDVAVPALEAGQAAWAAYRNAQCDYVGATFGGGSGTGIAISACRVSLGRARMDDLLRHAR